MSDLSQRCCPCACGQRRRARSKSESEFQKVAAAPSAQPPSVKTCDASMLVMSLAKSDLRYGVSTLCPVLLSPVIARSKLGSGLLRFARNDGLTSLRQLNH